MKLTFTGRVAILYTCKVTSTLLSSSSVYSKFTSVPPEVENRSGVARVTELSSSPE